MPNTFFRKTSANVGTSATTVGGYTVGGSTTTVVVGLSLSNTTGATINASLFINNGANITYIVKNAPIVSGGALVPIGGDQKVVLQTNDNVRVISDTASSLDVVMNIMEIT
jgi:hypothetical protein